MTKFKFEQIYILSIKIIHVCVYVFHSEENTTYEICKLILPRLHTHNYVLFSLYIDYKIRKYFFLSTIAKAKVATYKFAINFTYK